MGILWETLAQLKQKEREKKPHSGSRDAPPGGEDRKQISKEKRT